MVKNVLMLIDIIMLLQRKILLRYYKIIDIIYYLKDT